MTREPVILMWAAVENQFIQTTLFLVPLMFSQLVNIFRLDMHNESFFFFACGCSYLQREGGVLKSISSNCKAEQGEEGGAEQVTLLRLALLVESQQLHAHTC